MHYFHAKIGTVKDVTPGINYLSIPGKYWLVKIETIEVESHCGYTEAGKPNANHGPASKKEMEAAAIIKALSLIHISEPARLGMISYAVFCLKKKKN